MSVIQSNMQAFQVQLNLADATWMELSEHFQERKLGKGDHLFEAGENVSELFFIVKGLLRFYYLDLEGKEHNKSFAFSGGIVSSITSLVKNQPAPFYIQALSDALIYALPYNKIVAMGEVDSHILKLQCSMLEQLAIKKEQREADFLLLNATQRYEKFLSEFEPIADQIPNYHIASYLGITEVALSRIRKKMGLIGQ